MGLKRGLVLGWGFLVFGLGSGCSSIPEAEFTPQEMPKEVFVDAPTGKVVGTRLGILKTKVNFSTFSSQYDESLLCKNAFKKAAKQLWKMAEKLNAEAVIDFRSVTFYLDGKHETHKTAECSDDGGDGQVLVQGQAIRWQKEEEKNQ